MMALECKTCMRHQKSRGHEPRRVSSHHALEDARGQPREEMMETWNIILPYLRGHGALVCTIGQEYDWELHAVTSDWKLEVELSDYCYEGDPFHYLHVIYTNPADPRLPGLEKCVYRMQMSELVRKHGDPPHGLTIHEPTSEALATIARYLLHNK